MLSSPIKALITLQTSCGVVGWPGISLLYSVVYYKGKVKVILDIRNLDIDLICFIFYYWNKKDELLVSK